MSEKASFAAHPAAAAVTMKRLTIDLEAAQHTRFKTLCAQHGLTMADEMRRLLEHRIAEIEHADGA